MKINKSISYFGKVLAIGGVIILVLIVLTFMITGPISLFGFDKPLTFFIENIYSPAWKIVSLLLIVGGILGIGFSEDKSEDW